MRKKVLVLTALFALGLNWGGGSHVMAVEMPADNEPSLYELPSITVTADKRTTLAQETPMPLTVLTAQDIEDKNVRTVKDILKLVPNVSVATGLGNQNFTTFRGSTTSLMTEASPIEVYVDGVPVNSTFGMDSPLLDIERVEVLRGAQSTMYGKNAIGGIVNIITKRPTNEFHGKVKTFGESYSGYGLSGIVNGPIVEDLWYFSLAASHAAKQDWTDAKYGDKQDGIDTITQVKGQMLFTPSDSTEFALHANYNANRENYIPYILGDSYTKNSPTRPGDEQSSDEVNLAFTGHVEFDSVIFDSVTTYHYEDFEYRQHAQEMWGPLTAVMGIDWLWGGNIREKYEASQEFRLSSPETESGFAWLVGVYGGYGSYNAHLHQEMDAMTNPFAALFDQDTFFAQETYEFAPFGQVVIPVSDAFKITAGLRWHYTERFATREGLVNTLTPSFTVASSTSSSDIRKSWSELLPKLVLSYDITDDHMVYASLNRSFLPGGFNYTTDLGEDGVFDSQTAWNYEIGAKTAWLNNRLFINVAAFYTDFSNLQSLTVNPVTQERITDNAKKATAYGVEIDVTANLMEGLNVFTGFGYTHAQYDEFFTYDGTTGAKISYDGNRIEFVPEVTLNVGFRYNHESGFFATSTVYYTSDLYWDAGNAHKRQGVATVDAKIGYQGENFEAYVYGKNIFDAEYLAYYYPASNSGFTAQPQTFGIELAYKF